MIRDAAFPSATIRIFGSFRSSPVSRRRGSSSPPNEKWALDPKPPNMFSSLPTMTLPGSLEVAPGLRPYVCLLSGVLSGASCLPASFPDDRDFGPLADAQVDDLENSRKRAELSTKRKLTVKLEASEDALRKLSGAQIGFRLSSGGVQVDSIRLHDNFWQPPTDCIKRHRRIHQEAFRLLLGRLRDASSGVSVAEVHQLAAVSDIYLDTCGIAGPAGKALARGVVGSRCSPATRRPSLANGPSGGRNALDNHRCYGIRRSPWHVGGRRNRKRPAMRSSRHTPSIGRPEDIGD